MSADRAPIRVLHVDDDPDLRALAAEMLALESGRVETVGATDAAEALAALDPGTVDCVVSDYELVDTDGVELLRRVRERDASLPFVLFTGKGSEEVASEAISAGVTDYLQKGGGRETYAILANRIENAVEAHRASTRAEDRQRRLEQVVETVPGCVVQLDREGRFVLANDRAEEVLGLTESALSTRTYDDPEWRIRDLDGDPIPDEELPFRRVLDTGEPVEGVRHAIDWPDGTRKVLRVNGAPLFDGAGEVASVVFSLTDVTERLRDRRELEAMHDRLETLVSNLPVVLFGIDDSGTFTLSEGKGLAALGFDPGEVVGREVDEVYADVPAIREDVARALDGEPARGRYDLEGSVFDVVYEPVGSSRAETAVVGVGYDVTERTRRETQLQRSREQHRTLVENFPNGGVFMFDSDLRYTLAGGEGLASVGLTSADFEGKRPSDLFPPAIATELEDAYRDALAGEPRAFEQSFAGHHYRVRVVPVGEDGTPTETGLAVSQNVTERRNRRRELRRQNERLEEFGDVLSHDLRNPLNVATGRLELAREECDNEHLDDVEVALDRCLELISDLLAFAHEGTATVEPTPVSLDDVARDCWRTVETGGATLSVETDARIRADEGGLKQLFENLFRNGIDHGPADVSVVVGDCPGGFFVADDGPGIAADLRETVFDAGVSTASDGTGFGLSIVKRIADSHDWDVTLTEGDRGGTRVEFAGVETA
ncbi:hybrid sensor histidine kinase/response regulator [Halobaculum lipolyticum]|uniref:histidine kinase n=1 Tax=Halobaculum lipolyticum TaxID=3032001 RepID=A0ABD5W9Q0_9EURY|nr:PAS domain-containing protein [Halobaculum sp. DT31]